MKKIVLSIFSIAAMYSANAQFNTGQKLIGPSLRFNIGSNTYTQLSNSNITTERKTNNAGIGLGFDVLKFRNAKKATGLRLNYSFNNNTSKDADVFPVYRETFKQTSNDHSIGAGYVVRNIIPIKNKFNFYYEWVLFGNYSFGTNKQENFLSNTNYKYDNTGFGASFYITPGFTYHIKSNVLIDAALNNIGSIGYAYNKLKSIQNNNTYESKSSGFNMSSSLAAGNLLNSFSFSIKWIR